MSLGRARKSIPVDPAEPWGDEELELWLGSVRERKQHGERIRQAEWDRAARRSGRSVSTLRRRVANATKTRKQRRSDPDFLIDVARFGSVARAVRHRQTLGLPTDSVRVEQKRLIATGGKALQVALRQGETAARNFDLYVKQHYAERNQVWCMDAFFSRRYVLTANGRGAVPAWVLLVVDCASGGLAGATVVRDDSRLDDPDAAALTHVDALHAVGEAMRDGSLLGPIHGRPRLLVHDNAAYFTTPKFGEPLRDPFVDVRAHPIAPYQKNQNGLAERTVRTMRSLIATPRKDGSFVDVDGVPIRDVAHEARANAVPLPAFIAEVVAAAIEHNGLPHREMRHLSKTEAWSTLPGEVRPVAPEVLFRFMRRARVQVGRRGITIEGEEYVHPRLRVGQTVDAGYWEMDDRAVEIVVAGKRLGTAHNTRELQGDDKHLMITGSRHSWRQQRERLLNAAKRAGEDERSRARQAAGLPEVESAKSDADPWGERTDEQ